VRNSIIWDAESGVIAVESIFKPLCSEMISATFEDRIFLIINYSEDNKKQIRRAFNYIIDESHLFRDIIKNLMVSFGLGKPCVEFGMIAQSTYQAKEAIVDRIVLGAGKINQYNDDLHSKLIPNSIINFNRRKNLIKMVEILDINGITIWITETQSELQNLFGLTGQFILNTVNEIMEIVVYSLKNHTNFKVVEKTIILEVGLHIGMQNDIKTIFETLVNLMKKNLTQIDDARKSEVCRPIKKVQIYINEHYASDITLDEISAIVDFNATYFSVLFKKETGMGFLEYLTSVRVDAAKHLLGDTNKSIHEICYAVGYNDLKHFTKLFKKITKLTPSEYRKFHY